MGRRDSIYRWSGVIELDDAFIGGKKKGKRGRGAEGKSPIIVVCESREKKVGFIAMKAVDSVCFKAVEEFVQHHILDSQYVRTDAYPALMSSTKRSSMSLNVFVNRWHLSWLQASVGSWGGCVSEEQKRREIKKPTLIKEAGI